MKRGNILSGLMILPVALLFVLFSFCGAAWAQPNASGREGAPAITEEIPKSITLQKALPDGDQPSLAGRESLRPSKRVAGLSGEKDLKRPLKGSGVYTPVWKRLEELSLSEKENALLQLEVPDDLPSIVLQEVENIETLWNGGNYEGALEHLRRLEESEGQRNIAVGISWKVPRTIQSPKWGTDIRIGGRETIEKTCLDFDDGTGNLFAALKYTEGVDNYWSVNISTDDGQTWQETFTWWASYYINDISARVGPGYYYVGYTGAGVATCSEARIRRFYLTDGTSDATYGLQVIFDRSVEIREIALETNVDQFYNRIYYLAILTDYSLLYYWGLEDGLTWYEYTLGTTNAYMGLDAHWNTDFDDYYLLISYRSTSGRLHVIRVGDYTYQNIELDDATGKTAVAAYGDRVITAFEYDYATGPGIKYWISYDGGDNWLYGNIAEPSPGQYFWSPDLAARRGGGIALVYEEEVGEPDYCWYTHRDYDVANWSSPEQFNEIDVVTGVPMTVEWIPPLPGYSYAYGSIWIGGAGNSAWFDRNDGGLLALYQGPAWGSIAGGAYQTTDNFKGYSKGTIDASQVKGKIIPFREIPPAPNPPNMKPPLAPVGNNEVDDQAKGAPKQPNLLSSFPGIPDDPNSAGYSFIPPDPICAAGPDYIMACTNTDFAIFDKAGNKIKEIDATLWYENVLPGLDPGFTEPFGVAFDPQIVYDHFANRWIMIYIAYDGVGNQSYLLVSTSDDANPLGTWCNFAIPGNANGSTFNTNLNDYPKLGVNQDAFYVTANMFDLATGFFQYVQVRIFEKSQFYNNTCGPITWADFWDLRDPDNLSQPLNTSATVVPAVTFGYPDVEYLINSSPYTTATFMTLWTVWDPIGSPYMTAVNVPVTASEIPPDADQLGNGTPLIDVGGRRVRNAVYRGGNIWTAHSVANATGQFARARYVKIDVSGPTVLEDLSLGLTDYWYYYPAITSDASGNSIMVFNRSGYSEYAGIRYTGTVGGVPEPSAELKAGEANYVKTFGGTRNRWGDYNGIAVDPVNPNNVWMFAEYAASPANTWGTWWGEVSYAPLGVPQNLYAFNGYHGAVPLAWDPPLGYGPLNALPEVSVASIRGTPGQNGPRLGKELGGTTNSANEATPKQALLSYNVYRSTTPGGPYTLIANVDRQYYRDETVTNGVTYYYVVTAVYDIGESGYSNEDNGIPVAGGYYINSGWAATPPTLDGFIDPAQWASADVVDITSPEATAPVTLYVMNDNGHLYLAVDDLGNTTLDDWDQTGPYFDENHNREWPLSSPSGEGNFWVQYFTTGSITEFRGIYGWWPVNLGFDTQVLAPGVNQAIATTAGHVQFEVDIDLATSDLNAAPGDVIGYYHYARIDPEYIHSGWWPQELYISPWRSAWQIPAVYGDLELATEPTLEPPQNLYAFNGYHGAVPLAWDPPLGYGPLNTLPEVSVASIRTSAGQNAPHRGKELASTADNANEPMPKQTLLSYNVYRSTTPGGPYTLTANVNRQYYRDETVTNGNTYYYVVTAVYDVEESGYSNEDDGIPVEGGYYINSGWASTPPTLDGFIDAAEWASADVVDITYPGVTPPVTFYVMNNNDHLYLAVDDPGNTTLDDFDEIGPYFDENHNREWPPSSPSGEGNFWVDYLTTGSRTRFRGIYGWWPGNMGFDTAVPAPGVNQAISLSSGHVQYEVDIDLAASDLNAAPGDVIGYWMYALIYPEYIWSGYWPQEVAFCPWMETAPFMPAVYGDLELTGDRCDSLWCVCDTACVGQKGKVLRVSGRNCSELKGYSVCMRFDPDVFEVDTLTLEGTCAEGAFMFKPGWTGTTAKAGVVYAISCPPGIAPGDSLFLNLVVNIKDNAPVGTTTLELVDVPPALNRFSPCEGGVITPILVSCTIEIVREMFVRGDDDTDGELTISDPILSLCYQFADCPPPSCMDASDVDDDGEITISDPIRNLCYQFADCDPPPFPFPDCGVDPTEDGLDCASYPPCGTKGLISAKGHTSESTGEIEVGKVCASAGGRAVVPVYLTNTQPLAGFAYTIRYDPSVLTATAVQDNGLVTDGFDFFSAKVNNEEGWVKVGNVVDYGMSSTLPAGTHQVTRVIFSLDGEELKDNAPLELVDGQLVYREAKLSRPELVSGLVKAGIGLPKTCDLSQNYPNPFNPVTEISYQLPRQAKVTICIYNTMGQLVRTLVNEEQPAGFRTVRWNGKDNGGGDVSSGIYFCRMRADGFVKTRRLLLLR